METYYPVLGLLIVLAVLAGILQFALNHRADRKAVRRGYLHALEVHGLDTGREDMDTIVSNIHAGWTSQHADSWERGYRAALGDHGLEWSQRDSEEIWHNPYTAKDAAARTSAAIDSAANTITYGRR